MAENLEPQATIKDKTKLLYDAVSKDYNIGTYDDFSKKLQDSNKRKAFYDGVGAEYNLGTFDDFSAKIGGLDLKKKDQEVSLSVSFPTQSLSPDFEKGKAFAEKGFLMQAEGTKAQKIKKQISVEPSFISPLFGAPLEVKILEEGEEPSILANFTSSTLKGQIQGKVANILSAGKRPTPEELGEIAQLQSDLQVFPQSKSEKAYQEKGLKGLFVDSPALGVQFIAETMASSLSALFEASKRTIPTAVAVGAAAGAPFAGVGAIPGATYGFLAGQSAAGYNLSTSQDILNSLSNNGVDISNKESLIKAFSDEKKMAKIRNTAVKYGIPILIFDAVTAGLAGKLAIGAVGKNLSRKLLAGLGETGIQIGGGMGGEFTGQLASGKKVNWDDVVVEGLAEVPGGAVEVFTGVQMERSKTASNNKTLATQIATQGVQNGTEDAIVNLNRDKANNVITPEQHQEGIIFVEKAAQVADKIPEAVTGENKAKSIELLVERNDIKQLNDNLIQQKQNTDEAYHAGIDEEVKANEEKIKKIDSEVYNIAKKPAKETGTKTYTVDGEEVSQEAFEALQGKPIGTKEIIKAEVKPTEVKEQKADIENRRKEELLMPSSLQKPTNDKDILNTRAFGKQIVESAINAGQEAKIIEIINLALNGRSAATISKQTGFEENTVRAIRSYLGIESPRGLAMGNAVTEYEQADLEAFNTWKQSINKINAKYDAELKALEEVKPTEVETKITDIQKNLDLANKIEKARSGDKKAQEELTKFGIKYDKNPIYRHVSESEVNALNNGEQIEGKFKNGRVDVTTNSKPSTGANAEYRITFNDTYDFNKGDKAKVKNEELGDGWIAEGGYNKGDVLRIEKRNEDGSYTSVYEGKNKTVEGELNKQLSDLQGDKTQEVNIVKLTDLPDRAFAVGMTVEKFEDLKYKIQKEGFIQPIIIDKESGNVLDGQNRLFVAQDLGIKNVPSIYMDNPTREDLNEKIKELEKQYIPSQEVKPIEENKLKQYNRKGTITPDVINLKYDDNGKEVGGMTLGKYKNYLTLDHIYFSPEYRGTGLSKYAYKDALEIAKNEGYEGLMVGGQLTTEYKTKETYKNFATKELDIKNEKGNPYILLTDWIGKENIEETPEIRLMSPEKVQTTLYHGTNDLLQGDIKISREGIKMSPERLASGSSKEGWGFYTTPNVEQSEVIARELNPNMKDFPAGLTNEPAVKYSSFGGISPDKGFIYEIKLDPSAKVAYDNGLVKDFKNIKKQEFEKLRSLGIDAIYSSGEYVILNPSKIISNKIVLKNTGKKLVNVIPMGERGKLEMNKFKAVTPENLNSYLESILGKGYKKGDILTTGDKKGMTIYYNPKTDEFAAVQTGVRPNWEKVEEVKPTKTYQEALKEKQAAEKKQTRQTAGEKAAVTRKTIEESNKIEASDARSAALKYLTGGKLSWDAINEVAGRVKRATLNTGAREFKSEEARSRDYVAKKGEGQSLDEAADSIWNNLSEEMQGKMDTQDVKNALMMAVSEYNSKVEMAQALIDGYKEESLEDLESKYYERFGDNVEIEIDKELNQVPKNQLDIEQELINANYESEQQFQDDYWNTKEATNDFTEKAPSAKAQKAESAQGLAEGYKDLTINQKRQIINSKFDELLQELKIEKICPT